MRFRSILACAGAAPLLMAAAQPVRLQPSSPWVVDYAEDSCRLIRTFGEGKTLTKLAFESPAPDEMDMLVLGKPLSTFEEKVPARFLPASARTSDGTVAKTVTNGDPAVTKRAHFEPAELADGTRVASYYSRRVMFRIGP